MIEKAKKNKLLTNISNKIKSTEQNISIVIKTPNIQNSNKNKQINSQKEVKLQQTVNLCKIIDEDNFQFSKTVSVLETFNRILSNYVLRPKINLKNVEIRLKNETKKKEKEISEMKKNLEEKIDSVLEKANSCLDNIKQLSESKKIVKKEKISITEEKIKLTPNLRKDFSQTENISEIVKNLSNESKYNDEIKINEDNLNFYFTSVAENRKILKDLKEKNKNMKAKFKNVKNLFGEVFINSSKNTQVEFHNTNKENISKISMIDEKNSNFCSDFYNDLNSSFLSYSIINTQLFEKLFVKVLYPNNECDNSLFDVFSLWFLLKKIKNVHNAKTEESYFVKKTKIEYINDNNHEDMKYNRFMKKFCQDKLKHYLEVLFNLAKNKTSEINLDEEEIFGKDFFKIFECFIKIIKLKYLKIVNLDLKNMNENLKSNSLQRTTNTISPNEQQKEELRFLKYVYSMLDNNCGYSYQICKKSGTIK